MKRKIYHVVWRNEKWHVRRVGSRRSARTFFNKENATFCAALLTPALGQVVVHGKNGKIQREYTFGADPRRSRG